MNKVRHLSLSRGVVLALALLLLLAVVGGAAAGGSGKDRWAAYHSGDGITPGAVARPDDHYVVAFASAGSVSPSCVDGGNETYSRGDALFYEPHGPSPCWAPWFDATNSGLRANVDINGLHDECGPTDNFCDIYLSFKSRTTIPGVGAVEPQDVVLGEWIEGTLDSYHNWQLVFDGSDVGLTQSSEKIDGLYVFDPGEEPADLGCGILGLISTAGAYRVPDQWGGEISGGGEDVLGFCVYTDGWDTTGYWFLYHDGSAEGAPANSLIGLNHEDGRRAFNRFEFLTKGPFHVDSANGARNEVFNFSGQTGQYGGPTVSFSADLGATDVVDSFTVHHTE
jgi:hypothetical protein